MKRPIIDDYDRWLIRQGDRRAIERLERARELRVIADDLTRKMDKILYAIIKFLQWIKILPPAGTTIK